MPTVITLSACLGFVLWGWALLRMPSSGFDDNDRSQVWRALAGLAAFLAAGGCALWQAWGVMMLWPSLILFVLAIALALIGSRITNGPGSADERVAGTFFYLAAVVAAAGAALWWLIVVTIKAFY